LSRLSCVALQFVSLPLSTFIIDTRSLLHIACAAGPAGVKVFGEEKATFHRESQSGHSCSAYFLGKNIAVCFRVLLSSLHFTAFYVLLAAPMISLHLQLALVFLHYYCK
jgi:hypothetical protein